MTEVFPAKLLYAIDRWQKGGDHAAKMRRGQRLKQEVLALNDENLRCCPGVVYRRLALPQRFIWTFITTGVLRRQSARGLWTLMSQGVSRAAFPPSGRTANSGVASSLNTNRSRRKSSSTWTRSGWTSTIDSEGVVES